MPKEFNDFREFLSREHSANLAIDAFELIKQEFAENPYSASNPEVEALLITMSVALVKQNVSYTLKTLELYHDWKANQ